MRYTYMEGPLGRMLLTANEHAVTGVYFVGQKYQAIQQPDWVEDGRLAALSALRAQLASYLSGAAVDFDIPLAMNGTPFQTRVWHALLQIPYGRTITYGKLAAAVGAPASVRAVAAAVGRNPVSVVVPCHRVIGSNGSLTGYAGGLERKQALLNLESADLDLFAGIAHDTL